MPNQFLSFLVLKLLMYGRLEDIWLNQKLHPTKIKFQDFPVTEFLLFSIYFEIWEFIYAGEVDTITLLFVFYNL